MGRRNSVRSGGGSANWPGTSSQLVRGDGAAVGTAAPFDVSGGQLVAQATSIYDIDFTGLANDTIATTSTSGTRSWGGKTWNWSTPTNCNLAIVNGSGLKIEFTAAPSTWAIVYLPLSQLSLDYLANRYRILTYFSAPVRGGSGAVYPTMDVFCSPTSIGVAGVGMQTPVTTAATLMSLIGTGTGTVSTSDATVIASNVWSVDMLGCGAIIRTGTYSSGFPSIGSCRTLVAQSISTTMLLGSTTGTQTSTGALRFYLGYDSGTYTSTPWYIRRVRVEALP